jgi:MFS family permease
MESERWLILGALFIARTAMGFQFQAIGTLSPFLMAGLGIDYTRLGLLIGCYLLPGIVFAYPGGMLGQRLGDKRVVLCGLALMAVGGALMAVAEDYPTFLGARLLSGIGAVLLNVLLAKMATDWFFGHEIGTALALLVSSWPIGIGIALASLPSLATAFSLPLSLVSTAIAAALSLALVAAVYHNPTMRPATTLLVGKSQCRLSMHEIGLTSLAGSIWTLYNVGYIILVSFAPSLLITHGMSAGEAGIAVSLAAWTVIVTIPTGGMLIDRIGHATAMTVASLAVLALTIMLISVMPSLALIAFAGAVAGLPTGALMALPTQVLRAETRGLGMGVFFTWYYIGMAILPPAAGVLRDVIDHPGAPLAMAACLEIAATAILGLFRTLQSRSGLSPDVSR